MVANVKHKQQQFVNRDFGKGVEFWIDPLEDNFI